MPCRTNHTVNSYFYTKKIVPEVIHLYERTCPRTRKRGLKVVQDLCIIAKVTRNSKFMHENNLKVLQPLSYLLDQAPSVFFFLRLHRKYERDLSEADLPSNQPPTSVLRVYPKMSEKRPSKHQNVCPCQ